MTDVVLFGEILWDFFQDARGRYTKAIGGAPANVAVGLARLGVDTQLIGAVGRDPFGLELRARLQDEGVGTRYVALRKERTGITFVSRDQRGQPSFLFYRHESADMAITPDDIKGPMAKGRWLLLGTSTLAVSHLRSATEKLVELSAKDRGNIFLDLNVRPHLFSSMREMNTFIAELIPAAAVVKGSEDDLRTLSPAVRRALGRVPVLIVTHGNKGACATVAGREVLVPTKPLQCVDATGAGDAFVAGVLATFSYAKVEAPSLRSEAFLREALSVGNLMGGRAVSKMGAVTGLVGLSPVIRRLKRTSRSVREAL